MAIFEGDLEDFYTFLGPRTSDLVFKIAKEHRGKQKSCQRADGDKPKCGKRKGLQAAHLKGRERKIIIGEILEKFGEKITNTDSYKIDLLVFEAQFKEKHRDFFSVVEFMCAKHHRRYDAVAKTQAELKVTEEVTTVRTTELRPTLDAFTKSGIIKSILLNHFPYLKLGNCTIARISNDSWNFNPSKLSAKSEHYFLCYNQFDFSVMIVKSQGSGLNTDALTKKSDNTKLSINVPYSETDFVEKGTGYAFEFVEAVDLEEYN